MGFEVRGKNTALLEFGEGTGLDGATIRVSLDLSMRDFLRMRRIANRHKQETAAAKVREAAGEDPQDDGGTLDDLEAMYFDFGNKVLLSWDCEDNGVALPANGEGLLQLPMPLTAELFDAYGTVAADVSPKLNAKSPSGESAEAASEQTAA